MHINTDSIPITRPSGPSPKPLIPPTLHSTPNNPCNLCNIAKSQLSLNLQISSPITLTTHSHYNTPFQTSFYIYSAALLIHG